MKKKKVEEIYFKDITHVGGRKKIKGGNLGGFRLLLLPGIVSVRFSGLSETAVTITLIPGKQTNNSRVFGLVFLPKI